jgi:hypothetical protein
MRPVCAGTPYLPKQAGCFSLTCGSERQGERPGVSLGVSPTKENGLSDSVIFESGYLTVNRSRSATV